MWEAIPAGAEETGVRRSNVWEQYDLRTQDNMHLQPTRTDVV
jgi:hypothetical protein